jgi:hypothetical protein
MRVTLVIITTLVVAAAAAALAAQASAPVVVDVPLGEPTWMVLSGAALLAAGAALKRAA